MTFGFQAQGLVRSILAWGFAACICTSGRSQYHQTWGRQSLPNGSDRHRSSRSSSLLRHHSTIEISGLATVCGQSRCLRSACSCRQVGGCAIVTVLLRGDFVVHHGMPSDSRPRLVSARVEWC